MQTVATFESDAFNTTVEKDTFVNPGCFGDDLARWLMNSLRARGIVTSSEPGAEDFGWFMTFELPAGTHCCVVAHRPGEENEPGQWLVSIERHRGFWASVFGGRRRDISPNSVRHIHEILSSDREKIRNLRWHDFADFNAGKMGEGNPSPNFEKNT